MPSAPDSGPTVFDLACRILNRELEPPPIQEGASVPDTLLPRAPDFLPNAASINREIAKGNRRIAIGNLSNSPAGYHYHLAAFERLRGTVANELRLMAVGEAAEKGIHPRVLPAVCAQYETFSSDDSAKRWRELWLEEMVPVVKELGLILTDQRMCAALARVPTALHKSVGGLRLSLVMAFVLQTQTRCKERLVPCAACPRFFVAKTATAMTCSAACRQRYYRAIQDTDLLREKARKYKKEQREREAQASTRASSQRATGSGRPSRPHTKRTS